MICPYCKREPWTGKNDNGIGFCVYCNKQVSPTTYMQFIKDLEIDRNKWKAKAEMFLEVIEDVGKDATHLCFICLQKDNDRCFMCGVSCRQWVLDIKKFNLD